MKRVEQLRDEETNQADTPAYPTPCIHVLIYLFVYLVGFFVICFIGCSSKQTILVVWVLKLLGVNFWFLSSSRLRLAVCVWVSISQ